MCVCVCSSLATTTPLDQVDSLMMEIGEQAGFSTADLLREHGQAIPTAVPGSAAAAPAARGVCVRVCAVFCVLCHLFCVVFLPM